jgi:hypothetical protein
MNTKRFNIKMFICFFYIEENKHKKKYHMFTNIDSASHNSFSEFARVCPVVFDQNSLKKKIKNNWESYLVLYTTKTIDMCQNNTYLFFSKIPIGSEYNYLFVAKIFNLISSNDHLKYILRQLSKQKFHDLISFKWLQPDIFVKTLFSRWLGRLEIEKFKKYIESYYIYIYTSSLLFDVQNIQLEYLKNFCVVQTKDLFFLKIFTIRSQIWFHDSIYNNNDQNKYLSLPICLLTRNIPGIWKLDYQTDYVLKKEKNNSDIFLYSNQLYNIKKKLKTFSSGQYIHFLKNVIQCNKSNKQIDLIKKINLIVKYWHRSYNRTINKNDYKHLNHILYDNLWRWGNFRHTHKTSQWKKERYWKKINNNLYFSGVAL